MNPLTYIAQAHRLVAQAHECNAKYYEAIGNAEQAAFYRSLVASYTDMAGDVEAGIAESEAA